MVTGSSNGTLLRVWSTQGPVLTKIKEVRRGADPVYLKNISIDPSNTFISCSSDKGTIHIFSLNKEI